MADAPSAPSKTNPPRQRVRATLRRLAGRSSPHQLTRRRDQGQYLPMTPHNQTLLAKLAPMFGGQIENPAVAALGHILWGSQAATARPAGTCLRPVGPRWAKSPLFGPRQQGQRASGPLAGFDRDGRAC